MEKEFETPTDPITDKAPTEMKMENEFNYKKYFAKIWNQCKTLDSAMVQVSNLNREFISVLKKKAWLSHEEEKELDELVGEKLE